MKQVPTLTMLVFLSLILFSCSKDDPEIPNEEELITTLIYTLTPDAEGDPVVLSFYDPDGDGGTAPDVTGGTLTANQSYTGEITLLNETTSPPDNITLEIAEESLDHQFYFSSDIVGLIVIYSDTDEDGNPLGLSTQVTTAFEGSGSLTITLRHNPDKMATTIEEAGGETDIEVTFPINVE